MDLIKLAPTTPNNPQDPNPTLPYYADVIIDGWSSLIWTERFQEPGEFELRTKMVERGMEELLEGTLLGLVQSDDVMIVEDRKISQDSNGHFELVVSGRSADSILMYRHIEAKYGKKRKMARKYSPRGAAAVLIWNAVDNPSGNDVTREDDYTWNTKDVIPFVSVTDSAPAGATNRDWWLREGPLYPQLQKILRRGDLGLRMIRPNGTGSGTSISVATNLADRGTITRTPRTNMTSLRFDIFKGIDRSHTQTDNPVVAFYSSLGHLDSQNYFFSTRDYATACEIMSSVSVTDFYRNDAQKELTGWNRKVLSFDAGEPDLPDPPEDPGKNATKAQNDKYDADMAAWKNKVANIKDEFRNDATDDARTYMKEHKRVSLFEGDVSPLAPYKYRRDYFLGDTVTLYGDYRQTERMIVTEYVMTENTEEGERGYPGFTLFDE